MTPTNRPILLNMHQTIQITGLSKSSIYKKINLGLFPSRISLGDRKKAFITTEINSYMNALIQEKGSEQMKSLIKELTSLRKIGGLQLININDAI